MSQKKPRVEVLMSTYNAMKFGAEQLSSILNQEGVEVQLRVRDDGSTDGTQQWLDVEATKGQLVWWQGENLKPARSFMELLAKADEDAEYYAFADQDDIWLADKLSAAVSRMEKDKEVPALYFSRTQPVNEHMEPLQALTFTPRVTFGEALMCHLATGHTMVAATNYLFERGAKDVTCVCILAAPEGVATLEAAIGDRVDVNVVVAAVDECLNEKSYIVPGLGDAGDRLYGIVD